MFHTLTLLDFFTVYIITDLFTISMTFPQSIAYMSRQHQYTKNTQINQIEKHKLI